MHFAGSPRYIGTFVSRSDAINASEMGRRYFDTIPYNNLSPQQIEEIVISMRRVHMPQFQIARSPSRITNNAEEVNLNSSKAVTRPPDRHTSKDTRRDAKETTRKRNFDALGAKDLPRGICCRPSGRFVSVLLMLLLFKLYMILIIVLLPFPSTSIAVQQVNVDFARSRRYIGTFVSRSDAINASEMGRKYFDNIPYDNLSPQQIEEIVISMRKCARNYYDNLKDNNPSPDQLEGHFITMREAALELVKESTRSLVQQVLDDMILIVRENVGDETSSELERSMTQEVMEATSERVRSSARYLVPPPLNHQPLSMTQEEMEMRRERARSAAGYVLPGANAHQIGPLSTDPPSVNNASTMAIQRAQVAAVPEPRVTYPLEETTTTVAPSHNISKTVAERLFSVHRFLVSEAGTIGLNLKLLHSSKKCIISTVHSNSIAVDHGIEEGDEILPSHDNEDVYSHFISASKQRPLLFEVKRLYRHPGRLIARSSGAPVPHSLHRFIITTSGPLGVMIEKVDSLILLRNIAAMSVADIHGLQNDDILCIPYKNGQLQQIASLFVDAVKGGIRPLIIEVWRAVPLIVPSSTTLSVLPTIKPTIGEENVSNGVSKGTTTTEADITHAALQKDIAEEENNCIDDEDEATLPVSQMSQSLAPNSSNVFTPHAADHALHMQQLAAVEEKQATKYEYGNRYSEQNVGNNSDGTVEPATDPKILPDGTCQNGCWYPVLNGRMKCTGVTNRRDADNGTLTPLQRNDIENDIEKEVEKEIICIDDDGVDENVSVTVSNWVCDVCHLKFVTYDEAATCEKKHQQQE